jgi:hypothetical protein
MVTCAKAPNATIKKVTKKSKVFLILKQFAKL